MQGPAVALVALAYCLQFSRLIDAGPETMTAVRCEPLACRSWASNLGKRIRPSTG